MSAYAELVSAFLPGEVLETVVFSRWASHKGEPNPPISPELFGVVLTAEQAKPLMINWSTSGKTWLALVYPFYAYTNKHVWFIHDFDGATQLQCIPLNPYSMGVHGPELH
jgi:hypothetical protein